MKKGLIVAVALIIFFGVIFWFFINRQIGVSDTDLPKPDPNGKVSIPENWQTYSSEALGYSISFPEEYRVEENGDYSTILLKPSDIPSFGPANFIYISVVREEMFETDGLIYNYNNDHFKKLQGLEIGEAVSLSGGEVPDLSEYFTYTRVDDTVIDGYPTRRFENNKPWEFPGGTTEVRFIFDTRGDIYILGYYYGGDSVQDPLDAREAFNVIKTFSIK
jgi:hypothetical protein